MTHFATPAAPCYTPAQVSSEVSVCTHHEHKHPWLEGVRSIIATVRESQLTGHYSRAYGRKIIGRRFVASSTRIANPLELRNIRFTTLALTCVKLVLIRKNKGSHSSLAESRKRVYNDLVS